MNLEELLAAAEAGDPQAQAMLQMLLQPQVPQGQYRGGQNMPTPVPSLQQQLAPGSAAYTDPDTGVPDWDKSLNYYQDASGESADTITAGAAGGDAFAPGALTAKETWEPVKTPTRSFLRRLAGPSGVMPTSWEGVVAQALLEGRSPTEAAMAANEAIKSQMVTPPIVENDPITGQPRMSPDRLVQDFAMENFKPLAMEPDVDNTPNIRLNQDTGQYEMRGEDERTPMQQAYDKLGLPMPNEEYSYDWHKQADPEVGARYDQSLVDSADSEAMLRKLAPTVDARGDFLEGAGPQPGLIEQGLKTPSRAGFDSGALSPEGQHSQDVYDLYQQGRRPGDVDLSPAKALGSGLMGPAPSAEGSWGRLLGQVATAGTQGRGPTTTDKQKAEARRRQQFNPEMTQKRTAAINQGKLANNRRVEDAMVTWVLKNLQGRTPYGDAVQARQNVVQQAGGAPPWGM